MTEPLNDPDLTSADVTDAVHRSIELIHADRDRLAAEAHTILTRGESSGALSAEDQTRFDAITTEMQGLRDRAQKLARTADLASAGRFHGERAQGTGLGVSSAGVADPARRLIDDAHRRGELPDHAAERATALVTRGSDRSLATRWVLATGADAYLRAFAKKASGPEGHLEWTDQESAAWREVAGLSRAMGIGSGGTGGFMVPLTLDPAILLSSDGSTDPLRRISRVVQTMTNSWNGITSAGATAEWKAEGASVADASPTLVGPSVPVHLGDAFVPYSYEVEMDASGFVSELQGVLVDAADQLQAAAYMNGTGSGQPTGVTTALPGGSKVAAATADVIVAADIVGLQNALPPRFQANAQWCANLSVINQIASFETSNGALRFPEVAQGRLLRKPLHEASALDKPAHTASAGNDHVALYGDFRHFVIVDRIGSHIEFVQNLLDPVTGRPTGQRGALLWFRTGSDVLIDNAFRMLTA